MGLVHSKGSDNRAVITGDLTDRMGSHPFACGQGRGVDRQLNDGEAVDRLTDRGLTSVRRKPDLVARVTEENSFDFTAGSNTSAFTR